MKWLDEFELNKVIIITLVLGFAPFFPEPHVVQKIRMLSEGALSRPLDIFDLIMHGSPFIVLILKVIREVQKKGEAKED